MSITITRRFEFDAAHRVMGHEGKCANLHGHRYVAEVVCSAPELDELGRVIDFSIIKTVVGKWIDSHWDHTTILNINDPLRRVLESDEGLRHGFPNKNLALMDENPTAENMAKRLCSTANYLLKHLGIEVVSVRIFETPNCSAIYQSNAK